MFFVFSVSGVFSTESPSVEPLTSVADNTETSPGETDRPSLPRSQSERLLAANREFVIQERELREKYHDVIYNTAEKVMRISQNNQKKALRVVTVPICFPLKTTFVFSSNLKGKHRI